MLKDTSFMIVARIDEKNVKSALTPVSSPLIIYNEERFTEIANALASIGYGIVVLPKMSKE